MKRISKLFAALSLVFVLSVVAPIIFPVQFYFFHTAEATSSTTKAASGSIKLNKTKATLTVGETLKLKVSGASGKVTWSSSNKKIAKVSSSGKVTAVSAGKATIKAKVQGKTLKAKITVKEDKKTFKASKTSLTLKPGKSQEVLITLNATGEFSFYYDIEDDDVVSCKWADNWSSNTSIKLKITAEDLGTTTVKITNTLNKETIKITVTVESEVSIKLPSLPVTLKNYTIFGRIQQQFVITKVDYTIERSYDGDYTMKLFFTGYKTYDIEGSSYSRGPDIGWKLYDSNNAVVDSGTCYAPAVTVGESWNSSGAYDYVFDLPAGTYKLVLLDVD